MKKRMILFLSICFMIGQMAFSQSVKESVEPFQKGRQPSFSIKLDYSQKIVEKALEERLKKDKQKGKSSKGFMAYMQADYPTICDSKCDFYTKVTGNKKSATIFIFISKGYQNFISSGDDEDTAEKVKEFLKTVVVDVKNYAYKMDLEEQSEIVKKAEKEHKKLADELDKITEKKSDLEKKIKESSENIKTQKGILDKLEKKGIEKY